MTTDAPRVPLGAWLGRAAESGWKLPVLAGLLMAGAYYSPLPLLQFLFLLPMLYKLDRDLERGPRAHFASAWRFGFVGFMIGLHYWIVPTIEVTWLASLLWVLLAVAFSLRFGVAWMLLGWLRRRTDLPYGLLLPLAWLPLEYAQGRVPDLRMTADHVGHMLARFPFLIQFADLGGLYGVGLFLLAVSGLLYDVAFARSPGRRRACGLALATLFTAVLVYDAWAWTRDRPTLGTTTVSIVQPNVPLFEKRAGEPSDAVQDEKLHRLTREAGAEDPDLIVWPESARPLPLDHWLEHPETYAMRDVEALAREVDASLLVGVVYRRIRGVRDFDAYNAAVAVEPSGTLHPDWAAKIYLVPFVEATPFRSLFGRFVEGRGGTWAWLAGTFRPGPRDVVIETAGARIGVWVCYEELFPELPRRLRNAGAEFQVLITNDAWWGRTGFQRYLADVLRLRAIESRTDIVRAANTGISGFVDRRGVYRQSTPLFEEAVETSRVARTDRRTLYDRTGDVVVWLAIAGLLAAAVYARARGG